MTHELGTLQQKVVQAAKRRDDTLRRQFERARALAFPAGEPQERAVGLCGSSTASARPWSRSSTAICRSTLRPGPDAALDAFAVGARPARARLTPNFQRQLQGTPNSNSQPGRAHASGSGRT